MFIYLGYTGSSSLCGLSLVAASRGYSLVEVLGLLINHHVYTVGPHIYTTEVYVSELYTFSLEVCGMSVTV